MIHFTFAESGMHGGSPAPCSKPPSIARSSSPNWEGPTGDAAWLFAAFLALLSNTAPATDDPAWMSLRAAARRGVGQISELSHLLRPTGQD